MSAMLCAVNSGGWKLPREQERYLGAEAPAFRAAFGAVRSVVHAAADAPGLVAELHHLRDDGVDS